LSDQKDSHEGIIFRISEAYGIEKKWGWQAELAKKLGVSSNTLSMWKQRGIPSDILIKTSRDTGYPLQLLETDNDAVPETEELKKKVAASNIGKTRELDSQISDIKTQTINQEATYGWPLLKETIEAIEVWLIKNEFVLDPPEKSELVAICYDEQLKTGKQNVDEGSIANMMKLATLNRAR